MEYDVVEAFVNRKVNELHGPESPSYAYAVGACQHMLAHFLRLMPEDVKKKAIESLEFQTNFGN